MSKKPIDIYEEHLDYLAVSTAEQANAAEKKEIYKLFFGMRESVLVECLLQILIEKGIVSVKDFKRILEK